MTHGSDVAAGPASSWAELPVWTYSGDEGFGSDLDRLAADVFAHPHRGLWRTDAGDHDGFGHDSGLVAVTNLDLRRLMAHPSLTNVPAHILSGPLIPAGGDREASGYHRCFAHSVFTTQPPEHGPSKKLFARQLTAGALRRFDELMTSLVRERLRELGDGECDLRADFAEPVVARFWAEVLGLGEDEVVRISELAVGLQLANEFQLSDELRRTINEAGDAFLVEFNEALRRGIDSGRVEFLTALAADFAAMDAAGRPASLEAHFGVSLIDGLHTLPAEMVSSIYALSQDPAGLAAVRGDPTLVTDAYLEATRLHPGIVSTQRYALADFEFDGVHVPAGTLIMMMWLLGNRDPAAYEDPNEFRLGRKHRSDTTFGGGAHICPGRNIVRMFCQRVLQECTREGVEVTFGAAPTWSTASAVHEPLRAPAHVQIA